MIVAPLLLMLAQVGPSTMPLPTADIPLPAGRRRTETTAPTPAPQTVGQRCFALATSDPTAALEAADRELRQAKGAAVADPALCKATALGALGRWSEAVPLFEMGRDALPVTDHARRAEFSAGAAIAVEASGDWAHALALYDAAHADAIAGGDTVLAGRVARDRTNALYKLGRTADAAASLAEARGALPDDPAVWLISARFSRLQNKLAEAQAQIERAAQLAPRDPEVGLEAGVIAVLGARDAVARRSWQSVIALAPESDAARTAKGYLDQLGPETTAPPVTPTVR